MKIGYARVSTRDQSFDLQTDALNAAGCELIFSEQMTGATRERPELNKLLAQLRKGDVVVIWRLDRLGRSLSDLIALVNEIQTKGAELQCLAGQIDTTTAQGKLTFHLFAAMAEFEREITRERAMAGLASARARGRLGGRPKGLSKAAEEKAKIAALLHKQGELSIDAICKHLESSKMTLYRYLKIPSKSPQRGDLPT
jgi:DNA invertase Pin-like site-specific DNA recombinase